MRRLFHIHWYPSWRRVSGSFRDTRWGWSVHRRCRCGKVRRFEFDDWVEEYR